MNSPARCFNRVGLVVLVGTLFACGGDSGGGPITPKALALTGGDQQVACIADTLDDSLEVTLTGSNDKPLPGTPVNWAVTAGAATLSRAKDTTDGVGRSRVQLSLGVALTAVGVTATVSGLPSVPFSAAATFATHTLGQSSAGALASTDCEGGGYFADYHALTLAGSRTFTASLTTAAFDALVGVFDDSGVLVAFNDDSAGASGTNSFFKLIMAGGDYVIIATSFAVGQTGPYTLATTETPVAADSCLQFDVWVTRGITTNQEIKATDCIDNSGPYYADVFQIGLDVGKTMTITETSTAFDAELFLYDHNLTQVAFDDNGVGGGSTNARLTYTSPTADFYYIISATAGVGETGAYTLTIDPPTAATASALGSPSARSASPLRIPVAPKTRLRSLTWRRPATSP